MKNRSTKGTLLAGKVNTTSVQINGTALTTTATQLNQITSAFGTVNFQKAIKIGTMAIGGTALHAANLGWQNPEATAIIITRVVLDVTTKSTGASTIDVGTTATSATTSSDNLIDGVDSGTAVICADNIVNGGTNGKAIQKLAAGKWVTLDEASGDVTGLVGVLYVHYTVV